MSKKAALCNWEDLEDSLVKSNFIQGIANPQIKMDLFSEERDPLETLKYALTRESRQYNQQQISNSHAHIPQRTDIILIQRNKQTTKRRGILPYPAYNKIPDCWKCGKKIIKGHLENYPTKNTICNICKK